MRRPKKGGTRNSNAYQVVLCSECYVEQQQIFQLLKTILLDSTGFPSITKV